MVMKKRLILYSLLPLSLLHSVTAQWGVFNSPGNWNASGSWVGNQIPNNSGDTANITNIPNSASNVIQNLINGSTSTVTIGTLNFDSSKNFSIDAPGSLTFAGGGAINVTMANGTGTYAITVPIALSNNLTITQSSTNSVALTMSGNISESSAFNLTKAGVGICLLSGTNSYSGGTTFTAGTLQINSDTNLGAAGGGLTFNGGSLSALLPFTTSRTVTLTGAGTLQTSAGISTLSGKITGAGALTLSSNGTLILNNTNNDYTGGTTLGGGTISISSDANLGASQGALHIGSATLAITAPSFSSSRSGTLIGTAAISAPTAATLSGNFTGAGSLSLTGGGAFQLTGTNSYSGGTTISGGSSLTGNTHSIQGNVTIDTGASLIFDQTFDGVYSGSLIGVPPFFLGSLIKNGAATLQLTGNSASFLGITTINAGTLVVDGYLIGPSLTVGTNAILEGTGFVSPTTVNAGGHLNPGHGTVVGTLTVVGDLSLNPSAHTEINITPTKADQVAVGGAATLGGSLTIEPLSGFYGFSASYPIVTYGAYSGTFNTPISTNASFIPTITYAANAVTLKVDITNPFALFPFSNSNTKSVGNTLVALHAAGELAPDLLAALNSLVGKSEKEVNDALDEMQPAHYSNLTEMQAETGAQLIALFHRLPEMSCGCDNGTRFWLTPFGNTLHLKNKGMQIGSSANSGGVALGVDGKLSESLALGFGGAYSHSRLNWQKQRGHGEVDSFYGSVYADSQRGAFYLGASLVVGSDFYETDRKIAFTTVNTRAHASYKALDVMGRVASAYLFGSPYAHFYPYANFDFLYLQTESIDEHNAGGFNLNISARTDSTLRTEMGLGFQLRDINAKETACISPKISLGWVNLCPLQRPSYRASFEGTDIAFQTRGWKETWNLLNLDLGLQFSYRCFSFGLEYIVELSPISATPLFNQHGNLLLDWKW
jgi:autotransporter-associated beta strand protein